MVKAWLGALLQGLAAEPLEYACVGGHPDDYYNRIGLCVVLL